MKILNVYEYMLIVLLFYKENVYLHTLIYHSSAKQTKQFFHGLLGNMYYTIFDKHVTRYMSSRAMVHSTVARTPRTQRG